MMRRFVYAFICLLLFVAVTPSNSYSAEWKPSGTVQFIVPTSPGSGLDNAARVIQRIWQKKKIVDAKVVVVNKKGGGGAIAFTFLNKHAGDGHYILFSQPNIITNNIAGTSTLHYSDFTSIAELFIEYVVLAVKTDSPVKTGKDLIARLKKDPKSLTFGLASSRGNAMHMGLAGPLKKAGVEVKKLKVVIFSGGGKARTAVLGGHVDAIAIGVGRVVSPYKAGKLRLLAVASPQRLKGALADIPTWKDQGIEANFGQFRAIFGPKGLSRAQIAYWEGVFSKLVQTAEWQQHVDKNSGVGSFMKSEETMNFMKAQYDEFKALSRDLGLAK